MASSKPLDDHERRAARYKIVPATKKRGDLATANVCQRRENQHTKIKTADRSLSKNEVQKCQVCVCVCMHRVR